MSRPETAVVAPRRAPRARDGVLAAVYALLVLVLAWAPLGTSGVAGSAPALVDGGAVGLLLLACAGVLARRALPVLTLAVTGPAAFAVLLLDGPIMAYVLVFEALWSPVVHGSSRLARACTVCGVLAGAVLGVLVAGWPVHGAVVTALLLVTVTIATPLMWGWEVRHHREARRAAEALASAEHRLAQERSARAVEVERRRIAQDLHDLVAGHLSAVSLHAALAGSLPDERARTEALGTTREAARAALTDLRGMIDVLVDEDADTISSPSPTLGWEELRARLAAGETPAPDDAVPPPAPGAATAARASGTTAIWEVGGLSVDPAIDDPGQVDPAVRAALLRITIETVTNAVRHGTAPRSIALQVHGDLVELVGTNPFTAPPVIGGAPGPSDPEGSGLGLSTIGHQARAVGGRASAGPDPRRPGIWSLQVQVPRRSGARREDQEVTAP